MHRRSHSTGMTVRLSIVRINEMNFSIYKYVTRELHGHIQPVQLAIAVSCAVCCLVCAVCVCVRMEYYYYKSRCVRQIFQKILRWN